MVSTGLSVGWFANEEKSPLLSFTTQGCPVPLCESVSELKVLDTLLKHNIIDLKTRGLILITVRDTTMAKAECVIREQKQFYHILSHTRPYIHLEFF